jgi:hypothetical protein
MKFSFALSALALSAATLPMIIAKNYIITFKEDTPASAIEEAKASIISGGGSIIQEYDLLKGFAASVPDNLCRKSRLFRLILESLESSSHVENIEEDSIVHTMNETK